MTTRHGRPTLMSGKERKPSRLDARLGAHCLLAVWRRNRKSRKRRQRPNNRAPGLFDRC